MPVQSKFKGILDTVLSPICPSVEGIHSRKIFLTVLKHERAVAERNHLCLSVLAFSKDKERISSDVARAIGRALAERLRATDVVGWLDARTIGVLLPNTQVNNAIVVAEQVRSRLSIVRIELDYEFFLQTHDDVGREGGQGNRSSRSSPDLSPSSAAGHELSHLADFATKPVLDSGNGEGAQPRVSPLADICIAPPAWKRLLDILLCLFGLAFFGPLMILIALGIKIVSPGPVFFRQERIGFRGRPFILFKFRSMKLNTDTAVHKEHLAKLMKSDVRLTKLDKADARLIPFGKLFRASGLDELPQLFNILRGDMSFIGPRPCVPYEYEKFSQWHKRRCETYPGLTGLWQVSGKNKTTFTEMMRLDIKYGRRQSLREDIRILLQTIPAVVGQIRESSSTKGNP